MRRLHSASGGSRAVTAGFAGAALDVTWRLRDEPRPASQRRRRLKGRASAGFAGAPLEAGRPHFRMFLCRPTVALLTAASSRIPPSAARRAGAKRKAAGPSPQGRDPGFIGAWFTRDRGFGPEVAFRLSASLHRGQAESFEPAVRRPVSSPHLAYDTGLRARNTTDEPGPYSYCLVNRRASCVPTYCRT